MPGYIDSVFSENLKSALVQLAEVIVAEALEAGVPVHSPSQARHLTAMRCDPAYLADMVQMLYREAGEQALTRR